MKSYREYEKHSIGASDIASLTVRTPGCAFELNFGEDGSYMAYIVDEDATIGDHYKLVKECSCWIWIYDDDGMSYKAYADKIRIYQAGGFGCIIQLIGKGDIACTAMDHMTVTGYCKLVGEQAQ